MNATEQALHYENIVRQEWTNTTTIQAWQKWSDQQSIHCKPLTDALIEHAQLEPGLNVLDLASGVGEPSISIARKVTDTGTVVATDLSAGMLKVAEQNAANAGVNNIRFQIADAHALPFADNTFDRVVSRLGLMYFWDIQAAIAEIYRVLKPGGTASFVVWGADDRNEYFGAILTPFMQRREMPTPPADAPTPGRFGNGEVLIPQFEQAGFAKTSCQAYCEPLPWPGTPRELFEHFYDVAVPLQPYIDSFSEEEHAAALVEIEQGLGHSWDGEYTRAKASFNVISASK